MKGGRVEGGEMVVLGSNAEHGAVEDRTRPGKKVLSPRCVENIWVAYTTLRLSIKARHRKKGRGRKCRRVVTKLPGEHGANVVESETRVRWRWLVRPEVLNTYRLPC